jgi:RNA polymerase sigma factor (sigma-70 family)
MSNRSKISEWLEVQHGKIRKWASGMSHKLDAADVDDVAQTILLELLEKDGKIGDPEAFARSLTPYRVYDVLRQRRRAPQSLELTDETGEVSNTFERSFNILQKPTSARERCLDLRNAVGKLSEPHRAILLLRWVEGKTFATISNEQNLPESTARHYFQEAVKMVARTLKYVTLSGVVTDEKASVLKATNISARGMKIREYRRAQTDCHGQFAIIFLEMGEYVLNTWKTGFVNDRRHVALAKDLHLPSIVLRRAETSEDVTGVNARDARP